VVQQNITAGAQTTLAFKVEQSRVPEYWGQKSKDTVTALIFIRKIDNLARTNNWNDTTTYTNVANELKGFAWERLLQQWKMLDWDKSQAKVPTTICNSDNKSTHRRTLQPGYEACENHQHHGDHQGELCRLLEQDRGPQARY
jgi:hypothetical protein